MITTATNRKIRMLITAIKSGALIPRPEFQRRLVWSTKHKNAFIETVLLQYPFPEIYIAAGEVDPETGSGVEMLVDGQQRITTLFEYFNGSAELHLQADIRPYASLSKDEKLNFLEYEVVVRDLGRRSIQSIKEIFKRINSTRYSLNAMEIANARFDGELKNCAEHLAEDSFFETHAVFTATDTRRMHDTRFLLTIIVTVLSTYFNRDDSLEPFLVKYNDEFPLRAEVERNLQNTFSFIDACEFGEKSRVWKKSTCLH